MADCIPLLLFTSDNILIHCLDLNKGATQGVAGEEKEFMLELRLMADVGLIGMPNVGKSSLLRVMTNATPRVASYAFSTRQPHLGRLLRMRVSTEGQSSGMNTMIEKALMSSLPPVIVADLPGLILGASEGKGLGHR